LACREFFLCRVRSVGLDFIKQYFRRLLKVRIFPKCKVFPPFLLCDIFLYQLVYILFLNVIQVRRSSFHGLFDCLRHVAVMTGEHERLPSRRLRRPQKDKRRRTYRLGRR